MSCSCCHHENEKACRGALRGKADPGASEKPEVDEDEVDEGEDDDDEDPATLKRRIIAAAVLLVAAVVIQRVTDLPLWAQLLVFLPSYVVAGGSVIAEAVESFAGGHPFDEDFLMSIATVGALLIGFVPGGEPQFAEAVFVMLFFQVGELFEGIAEGNSRRSIKELLDIRPDAANVERNGEAVAVDPSTVQVGEVILVRPGEKIPLDGTVVDGTSSLDTRAITGESVPRSVSPGEDAFSGCVNLSGVLRLRVTKAFGESTASKIIDLVKNAGSNKSRSEKFIKRFARVYTPIVVLLAIAVAVVPPLASGDFAGSFATWLLRALTFLVVSCPCALVLSVPLTFFGGIGGASKRGILVKGSNYLEALAKAQTVVFDKTGTLTKGVFKVTTVHPSVLGEERLLHLAAHVEHNSTHPIAAALRDAYPSDDDGCVVTDVTEEAGRGVLASVNGHRVAVGNDRLMEEVGATWEACHTLAGTIVHVAVDGKYAGHIHISDEVKDDSREAIASIRAEGVRHCVMLTGDRRDAAAGVARDLGIDEFHAELLPAGKVEQVERLLSERQGDATLAFVGDGINDAPVLARADVGIAMGAMGSDAAIEAADVVLMDDKPSKIAVAIRIARRTARIARQNIAFAIAVKVAILCLAAVGLAPMWLAIFGDVGVMVLCVLNATQTLR
ncbi:MAG: heavy metal translocating P-type ATPase [Tractidigestivibacter sp.]|uniref:heavy metal translocating P-type ATPase n=1 Tax=Tractidigestivibacter sp. TaxID=2847320 RepID=UPI002A82008E|nr:heavy metal translocating P-type ATPase [Tractidigestivibacter sp.]MDY4535399.1 heavy metal translocating P-type ATPase [Tractidigestivibacter sp.]